VLHAPNSPAVFDSAEDDSCVGQKRRAESDLQSSDESDDEDQSHDTPAPTAKPEPVAMKALDVDRQNIKLAVVQRNRKALRSVETRDFMGKKVVCSVVDYLRRDKANTSRARRKPSDGPEDMHAKMRRPRPRYLNVLVDEFSGPRSALEGLKFDLFESSEDCVVGESIGRDLEFAVEKGSLLRIDVDCIDPARFPRSEDRWLALRCRDAKGTLCFVHFMLSWWKAKRHRASCASDD